MRSSTILLASAASFTGFALALMAACSGDTTGATTDSGSDVAPMEGAADTGPDTPVGPGPDGSMLSCTLGDKSDPVGLCTQKMVLDQAGQFPGGVYNGAYVKGKGVATSWDSMSGAPDTDDAGVPLHSWNDDLAFASSIAYYHCSSGIYGDTTVTPALDAALQDLATLLEQELATLPAGYEGETYIRLRNAQAGLYYTANKTDGDKVKAIADAYGRAIQTKYAKTIGGDGGASVVLLGTDAGGGAVAYASADVVTGAAALLHMAYVHLSDDPTNAALWQATAKSALAYVWQRARDTQTGLFYGSLVTSSDPGHDTVADDGSLLTDVQATIVLALARAQLLTNQLAGAVDGGTDAAADAGLPQYLYDGWGNTLIDALTNAGLYDGPSDHMSTNPGAFMEGLRGGAVLTNKTTLGNAYLLGGLHRIAESSGVDDAYEAKQLRAALLQLTPPNSSLLSVVQNPSQNAYLRAASKDFHFAVSYAPDGGPAGQEPRAQSYTTAATAAMVEGMTQLWHGGPDAHPDCAL